MKNKNKFILAVALLLVVVLVSYLILESKDSGYKGFGSSQQTAEQVQNLSRDECICWIGANDPDAYCAPVEVCE